MDPIRYTLSFPAPHTHYVHVRAEVPAAGRDSVELSMAVWTPGSYLVGEFSRHVESVTAESPGGIALRVEKTAKNRWRVATAGALIVIVSYRVYGREMSVRTNWIESDFAFVNGAPTFLTLAAEPRRPHEVSIVPASGWTRSIRALEPAVRPTPNTTAPHTYCAPDDDTLVDSPILIGNPELYEFSVDGVPHVLANAGDTTFFDSSRVVKDLEAIVRAHKEFWGSFPYITVTCSSYAPAALRRRSSSIRSRTRSKSFRRLPDVRSVL